MLTPKCVSPFQWPNLNAAHSPNCLDVQLVQHHVSPFYRHPGKYTTNLRSYFTVSIHFISPNLRPCSHSFAISEQNNAARLGLCILKTCLYRCRNTPGDTWIIAALSFITPNTPSPISAHSASIRYTLTPKMRCNCSTSAATSERYIWICDLLRLCNISTFARRYPVSRIERLYLRLQPVGP